MGTDEVTGGIDPGPVTAWLAERVPELVPPLTFAVIAGGRSNLTYQVTDSAGGRWVLRRPPLHGVLASAHDMGREHRVIAALHPTPVPVPPTVGLCEDPQVNGAPFFVMGFVDGLILRDREAARLLPDHAVRRRAAEDLVDTLVALHAVDPDGVGLGTLGRREGYVARQLRRWHGQWQQSRTRPVPAIDEVHARLSARIPEQQGTAIVHGDYRLDNTILSPDGRVAAVLDWELCTLGDPLADVGLLMVYWQQPGDAFTALPAGVSAEPGFPARADLRERYAATSGRDLSELDFYVALANWKVAIVLEGVFARFTAGAYGHADPLAMAYGDRVPLLAEAALAATQRSGR
jgi:aminoglycoside phosphotransferase (APT) family kinase protein